MARIQLLLQTLLPTHLSPSLTAMCPTIPESNVHREFTSFIQTFSTLPPNGQSLREPTSCLDSGVTRIPTARCTSATVAAQPPARAVSQVPLRSTGIKKFTLLSVVKSFNRSHYHGASIMHASTTSFTAHEARHVSIACAKPWQPGCLPCA